MKKIVSLLLSVIMLFSMGATVFAENYVTLYAEGKSKVFPESKVTAQLTVGWYTEPVQRLYAEGKSKLYPKSKVAAQLTVGWYTEPVQRLYAEGKSKLYPKSKVAAQLTVGWYTEPVQRLYAEGKSKLYPQSKVAAQLTVGWYTEPVTRLYNPNTGESKLVTYKKVSDMQKQGWLTGPDQNYYYQKLISMKEYYPEGMRWTNDDYYPGGFGCHAFALIMSDAAFGNAPRKTIRGNISIDMLKVGDILRINNNTHTVIVLEVHQDYVVIAEGNYNSSIHWGRTLSKEKVAQTDYVITRY